jgi:hypothetical protein
MDDPWQKLLGAVLAYRREKGFDDATQENAGARFACVAAEIWEVEEALALDETQRDPQHWAIRSELAGVATYTLGLQYDLGFEIGTQRLSLHAKVPRYATPADLTAVLRRHWRTAFEAWRRNDRKDAPVALEILLCAVIHVRDRVLELPGSLSDDVLTILGPNDRPWRHGGKHPLT